MPDALATDPQNTPQPRMTVDACLRDGRPNWDAISFEVHCSRCDYNLRGLTDPRCPECGLEFEWHYVLDRSMLRTVWLFEENCLRQPIRSWWKTLRRSLRPWRFWRDVSIHQTVHAGPLWFLILTSPVIPLVLVTAGMFAICGLAEIPAWLWTMGWLPGRWLVLAGNLDAQVWEISHGSSRGLFPAEILLAEFLLVLLILISLRQTLARCRLRRVQVLRAVAYACLAACTTSALVLLSGLALEAVVGGLDAFLAQCAAANPAFAYQAWSRKVHEITDPVPAAAVAAGLLGPPVLYVSVALKRYLGVPHAIVVTIASFVTACLCILLGIVLHEMGR